VDVYAAEATITTEILRGGGATRTQNRADFLRYVGNNHVYFNGRLYSAGEFFDTHNGSTFRIRAFVAREARERFGIDDMVREATLIDTVAQPTPPVQSTPAPPVIAPATPPVVASPAPSAPPQIQQQPVTQPQQAPQPVATPVPPASHAPQHVWDAWLQEVLLIIITTGTAPVIGEDGTVPAVLFDGLTLLDSDALLAWAEIAPSPAETRNMNPLPTRRITDAEIATWIEEYRELGGINAFELEVVRLINEIRVGYGLNPLAISMELSMATRFHSQDMYENNFLAHISPNNGRDRTVRFGHQNIDTRVLGARENAGGSSGGRRTPEQQVDAWMNSPGHRAAILMEGAVSIGVGRTGGLTAAKFGS